MNNPSLSAMALGSYRLDDKLMERLEREERIVHLMCLLPAYAYKTNPTRGQAEYFLDEALKLCPDFETLHQMLCSGEVSEDLAALIKEHAQGWRPAGKVVESDLGQRLLGEGK